MDMISRATEHIASFSLQSTRDKLLEKLRFADWRAPYSSTDRSYEWSSQPGEALTLIQGSMSLLTTRLPGLGGG